MIATCSTCQHWKRLPDKVYQPHYQQKPAGDPVVTVMGECQELDPMFYGEPVEDGIAFGAYNCSDHDDKATTGPLFGCVHHSPIPLHTAAP